MSLRLCCRKQGCFSLTTEELQVMSWFWQQNATLSRSAMGTNNGLTSSMGWEERRPHSPVPRGFAAETFLLCSLLVSESWVVSFLCVWGCNWMGLVALPTQISRLPKWWCKQKLKSLQLLYIKYAIIKLTVKKINLHVCVALLSALLSEESGWAGKAGYWGWRYCLQFRLSQSFVVGGCVPAWPKRRGGEVLKTESSTKRTLPLKTDAGAPRSALCRRRRHSVNLRMQDFSQSLSVKILKKYNENLHRSFGFQLVKTVRSLLSLILSQGISSSSADKLMAFTLSSRLNTLGNKTKTLSKNSVWQNDWIWHNVCTHFSHVSLKEQVQKHPLSTDLGKVQWLVQPVPERYELRDFLKRSILICLDDIFWGLVNQKYKLNERWAERENYAGKCIKNEREDE